MRRHVLRGAVASLLLLLGQQLSDPAAAKVIRDHRGAHANQAVEVGGHRLRSRPQPSPPIPYSFIGAIASEARWPTQCSAWPWGPVTPVAFPQPLLGPRLPIWPPANRFFLPWGLPSLP